MLNQLGLLYKMSYPQYPVDGIYSVSIDYSRRSAAGYS